jgi:hypothetical protein
LQINTLFHLIDVTNPIASISQEAVSGEEIVKSCAV